jgi:hypothetical protein
VLQRGALPGDLRGDGVALADAVYADYVEHAKRIGITRRAIETELGHYLARHVPGLLRERRLDAAGVRRRSLVFPSLAVCRAAFAESLGRHARVLTWPDDQPNWTACPT